MFKCEIISYSIFSVLVMRKSNAKKYNLPFIEAAKPALKGARRRCSLSICLSALSLKASQRNTSEDTSKDRVHSTTQGRTDLRPSLT